LNLETLSQLQLGTQDGLIAFDEFISKLEQIPNKQDQIIFSSPRMNSKTMVSETLKVMHNMLMARKIKTHQDTGLKK
jgi:hypothetical protein